MTAWYEELFDDRYLDFHEGVVTLAPSEREATFLDRALALPEHARVLDLGCGFGRHSVALAMLGHTVTGVDLSPRLFEHAAAMASREGVTVEWVRRDMRDLSGLGPFDACVCLYTALGYFDDAGNEAVVRGVREALDPGGVFVLDVANPLAGQRGYEGKVWREHDGGVSREASRYDAVTGRLWTERTIFARDGRRVELPPSDVRLYTPSEVARLLRDAGFEVEQLYGALADVPFRWQACDKQVWVARKP
jgi:SAM-dependent methyltransferase